MYGFENDLENLDDVEQEDKNNMLLDEETPIVFIP